MTEKMLASTYDSTAHEALKKAKERQAYYYYVGAKQRRRFSVGDTVRTRRSKKQPWDKAEVTKVLPYRSYEPRFEDGSVRRRTSRHVRFSPEPPLIIRDEIDAAGPPQRRPAAAAAATSATTTRSSSTQSHTLWTSHKTTCETKLFCV